MHAYGANALNKKGGIWPLTGLFKIGLKVPELLKKSKKNVSLVSRARIDSTVATHPFFPFILIEQVVIDSLHLFLRISDVLINLLIRDLRILEKATSLDEANKTNIKAYKTFLNESCKIRFQWYFEKEAKKLVT